jgi:hypothetical protein
MGRSIVKLPRDLDIYADFEVYVNGVPQYPDIDYAIDGHTLIFDRTLRKDHVSGWRWLLGAWGVGTYKQDDTIDVRYQLDGETRLAHDLAITTTDDDD